MAAEACGVKLVLSDYWMTRMTESYARRGRVMPPNNRKQAMLPANAEFIDNPIGTACGFAVTIGKHASSSPRACRAKCAACWTSR